MPDKVAVRNRDRAETTRRILEAALIEFLEHGRAGARVDRVAAAAGVNKANIYHYFDSKDGLFDALLSQQLAAVRGVRRDQPAAFRDRLAYYQDQQIDDQAWIRLVTWEALEYQPDRGIAAEEARTEAWQPLLESLQQAVRAGALPRLDVRQLQLSLVALVTFPVAFPQFTKMITGLEWDSDAFRRRRKRFLRALADHIGTDGPRNNAKS